MGGKTVLGLFVYPFKSAGGIEVSWAEVDAVGLRHDRTWMAVDAQGGFVSQRTHPAMALIRPRWVDAGGRDASSGEAVSGEASRSDSGDAPRSALLELTAPGMEPFALPAAEQVAGTRGAEAHHEYKVWFSSRYAVDGGDEAAAWISDYLGEPCRVVRSVRPAGAELVNDEGRVRGSFADAYPALVISRASLDDLNTRLDVPLPMDRFRPNIVVDGFEPYQEDAWGEARIGDVPTRGGKPCPRCATTLVDQATAEKGVEPLKTLNTYRRNDDGQVDFGVNIHFRGAGVLRVGDTITPRSEAPT